MKFVLFFLMLTCPGWVWAQPQLIRLDGNFDDWQAIGAINDPEGDHQNLDLLSLKVTHDAAFFYLALEFKQTIPFQESPIQLWVDTDNDLNTGQRIQGIGADLQYDFGQKNGQLRGQNIRQNDIGLISLPTHTSQNFEIAIRRAGIFTDTTARFFVQVDGNGDKLPDANALNYTFTSQPLPAPYQALAFERDPTSHFRLASYNVRFDSPFDPGLNAGFRRVIQSIDADIYCFNEFFSSSSSQVQLFMQATLPGTWYASKEDAGNVTLSRWPILQSQQILPGARMTANLVDLPDSLGTDLLVINCHLRCCAANAARQREADALVAYLRDARNNGSLPANTPIVLAGDFNLVGDVQQLQTLLTGDIQDEGSFGADALPDGDGTPLQDLLVLQADRPWAITWRSPGSAFAPGRLDYIIYSDSRLEARHAFIPDSRAMTQARRSQYGLEAADTEGSDHLPLVADFSVNSAGSQGTSYPLPSFPINIFPQPTKDKFWVEWEKPRTGAWVLYDLRGRKMLRESFRASNLLEINCHKLSAGVFLLQLQFEDATLSQKIILH